MDKTLQKQDEKHRISGEFHVFCMCQCAKTTISSSFPSRGESEKDGEIVRKLNF
jgi:hypothetical protein